MSGRLAIFVLVVALVHVVVMIELVRRRQLREKYALLWLGVAFGGVVLALGRPLIDRLARAVGVSYSPSALFALAILFLLVVCAHLSFVVSRLEDRVRILASEVSLLRSEADDDGRLDTSR